MLLEASQAGGIRMSDREMRDEVMTLFLAGHETTALAVAWSLHLLATHPETQSAVHDELAEVLGDRPPNVADVPRLHRLEAVVLEALRLFPPAYAVGREAIRPTTIAGTAVPKGTIAFISVWAAHRDPVRFPEPSAFRPERWLDGLARRLPRGAYLPFAEGPRKCIGAAFAMQEAVLLLATIARRFRLQPVEDHVVRLRPAVTLRPADGIKLRLRSKPPREAVVRRVSPVA